MLITVGTGATVEDGIVFSIRQQNPTKLCFIYSKNSEKTVKKVLLMLGKTRDECILKCFDEVNDVEILYEEYSKYIDEFVEMGYDLDEIVADYTSGTKSMSAALVNAAIVKGIKQLCYVNGHRDEQGRVVSGTERLTSLIPSLIFTEQRIHLFKKLFNHYQYEAALQIFEDSHIHPKFRKICQFYAELARAYSEWDGFLFNDAFHRLSTLDKELVQQEGLETKYTEHLQFLQNLLESQSLSNSTKDDSLMAIGEYDAIDLFSNTFRRMEEGKYDDALSRLYRLVEMLAQIEYCKIFKKGFPKTGYIEISAFPKNFPFARNIGSNKFYQPNRSELFDLLKQKGSTRAKKYLEVQDDFENLLKLRNHSRLAHGQQPIPKEVCEKLINLISQTFDLQATIKFPKLV